MSDNIKGMFRKADSTGEGLVSLEFIQQVFAKLGTLSPADVDCLASAVTKTADGRIKYEDFVDSIMGGGDDLSAAVALLNSCELIKTKLPGLGVALLALSSMNPPPDDYTTALSAYLRASRPVEVKEYGESVLEGLVMKCDEFANIHLLKSERLHPEAWNFRKTDMDMPVYGSGQCHLQGILHLAKMMKSQGYNKVLWFNMREEPVVFLDGQACAPRSKENMNENVDWLMSVERHELDAMEKRLLKDCIDEAAAGEKKMGVFYQLASGANEEKQLSVTAEGSFSVRGAFDWLKKQEGVAELTYSRVPIADETAPEEPDFDQLVMELRGIACSELAKDVALVFNCQMGRGRTTTGMVCGAILMLAGKGWTPPEGAPIRLPLPTEDRNLKRGEFKCILQLLSLMDKASSSRKRASFTMETRGLKAKLLADHVIDNCAHAQNMVEAIIDCELSAGKAEPGTSRPPEFWRNRARAYLHRYAHMLLFAAYALEEVKNGFQTIFSEWLHRHWQFKRIIKNLSLE